MSRTRLPSGVSSSFISRIMSPVAICGMPYVLEMSFAWVPFPDPCGPSSRMFTISRSCARRGPVEEPGVPPLFEEAFVGAHHHLRLHLPHRVERNSDDDQQRGA